MNEAFWIIDQLICQGIDRFCIAPGSRNTPLVIAAAEHPLAKTMVHYDERGIGFYALGFGKGAKKPAALICTSGTALGNLLPSVMEAHHSETPIILLTADRPIELRDCGANQTTDQVKIFSHFVRWQIDIPPGIAENAIRSFAAQGTFHAMQNPKGPVQINCQFREPLYASPPKLQKNSPLQFCSAHLTPSPIQTDAKRGVILIGEIGSDPRPILKLASRLQWPVFADLLSNARSYPSFEQIRHFDWLIESNPSLRPEFTLHFGKRMTSKKILNWPATLHVSPSPFLQDPTRSLKARLQCDIAAFCETFTAETDPSYLASWKEKDAEIDSLLEEAFHQTSFPFTEAHAMRKIGEILPKTHAVFLGNGMPIRDADHFLFPQKCLGFFANRGLSGIDGNIATAAGLSDALDAPLLAFLGDQACLYDLNSLPLIAKTRHPVTLIVSNNFGSGIFSHLPISKWPHFETYMASSHSWQFAHGAKMFSLPYLPFDKIVFEHSALIELVTDRKENFRFQCELLQRFERVSAQRG
ncbi:MAG TPA: 2-succinyl-5-enolpyruvyl-6-hydroxy-3-cyclohexene-1-carboxylic-acid synthase [Chlamydiales bacterium]|nr:2-succinyl-5-enolpyruvyl-6-hydroxy-3-cyclohexene-1-carboxylic-acid synthase [Chlamydiales bacterium]